MHRSRLLNIVIDCDDLEAGTRFWSGALGREPIDQDEEYTELGPAIGGLLWVILQRVPEPKTAKSRVHLDFTTDDLEAEVARLEALGARRIEQIHGWWVMNDPCGNEFCVLPNWREEYADGAKTWGEPRT